MLPSFPDTVITYLKIVWSFVPASCSRRGRGHSANDAKGVAFDLHFIMSGGDSRVTSTMELEKVRLNQSNTSTRVAETVISPLIFIASSLPR
jgi:hypothetical protein